MLRSLIFLALLLVWPAVAQARTNAIQPELVAEGHAIPGGDVELAILMHTSPGWHGYWLNPGDAGLPMAIEWQLPRGFSIGPLRYPVPTRLEVAGLTNYVYERDYAALVRLMAPAGITGQVPIRARARWLACTDKICVPEQGEFSLNLPTGGSATMDTRFNEWRRALPRPLASEAHYVLQGGKLLVAVPLPASVPVRNAYVFPITDKVVDYEGAQSFRRTGDWLVGDLPATAAPTDHFDGVIAIDGERGLQFHAIPGRVLEGGVPIGAPGWNATLWAVLGALLGGILLNLMPCVFPVLALKALHLARAGENDKHARSDALAYTAGAVVGTGALGVVLLAIRAAGTEAGWAFQLQDPRTIMLLLLLATAITANLIGLLEVPVLGGSARPAGGFGTGALAAFVATPCAGPFLGAALGTALLLPGAGSLLVFAALGFGLALPFLLISIIPALRKLLPRPGLWMKRLQRFLAIPMGATAIACIWLLYRQAGPRGLVIALIAVAVLTALLIWYGFAQRREAKDGWVILPLAIAVVGVATWQAPGRTGASPRAVAGAATWSEAAVARELAAGHPLFVYFTADWCLTCKVNEEAAIDRAEVRDAFRKAGVKVLAADWTNGDPAITRFLESRGRAGVPYYLWYAPGRPPEELPQILTPSMLTFRAQAPAKR